MFWTDFLNLTSVVGGCPRTTPRVLVLRIPGTPTGAGIVLGYRTLEQACSPVSPGDATLTEEIHRLTRVTARGLHLPLQAADKRRRQGTQGQRQVGAGLRTEKVDIVYN